MTKRRLNAPMLIKQIPRFDNLSGPDKAWAKAEHKLNLFREQGGHFRDEINETEKLNFYDTSPLSDGNNNCYASALGYCVKGPFGINPGVIGELNKADTPSILSSEWLKKRHFDRMFKNGLAADGVLKNIPIDQIKNHFPIIGMTYELFAGFNDYHFIVPHIDENKPHATYHFTERLGKRGNVVKTETAEEMMANNFQDNCRVFDVYFVPNAYMGREITFERFVDENDFTQNDDYQQLKQIIDKIRASGIAL